MKCLHCIWYKRTAFLLCCIAVKLGVWVRVMRNASMLRGTMLFGKSSMRISTNVSNRCSIIVLAFLYPSCYPWRNCYFGRKCYVVEIWFCVDWQSVVTLGSLLWLLNTTMNLTTLFVLVLHVGQFLVLFFWISLVCVIRLFCIFLYYCVCSVTYCMCMLHSCVLKWWWRWWLKTRPASLRRAHYALRLWSSDPH